jgi:hemerythrin superfamily protein
MSAAPGPEFALLYGGHSKNPISGGPMDIYQALQKDHDAVKTLLAELVALPEQDIQRRDTLVAKIRDELVPHSRAEEAVFYNMLRMLDVSKTLAMHGYTDHIEAEGLLRLLQTENKFGVPWKPTAVKLQKAVTDHIQEEETEMFAAARQLFTSQEAEAMAYAFQKLKPGIKDGGLVKSTMEMVANMMPPTLTDKFRGADPTNHA